MPRFRELYGAGPVHLLALLASFAIAAYALSRALSFTSHPDRIVIWLVGSIVAHDLILFPLYGLLGLVASRAIVPAVEQSRLRIAALNHLRAPALASGLLLIVWFPLVAGTADRTFERNTGLANGVYFERWLLLTGLLFVGSALVLALRVRSLGGASGPPHAPPAADP